MDFPGGKSLKPYKTTVGLIALLGAAMAIFDILRKTLFVNASWNYNYPPWNFVYSYPALILLIVVLTGIVYSLPKLLSLSERQFTVALYLLTAVIFLLAFLSLPIKAQQALDLDHRGLYQAAVVFVERGPLTFFSTYHSMVNTVPKDQTIYTQNFTIQTSTSNVASNLSALLQSTTFIPGNEQLAKYTAQIKVQKHGPIAPLLVVPFLYIFGTKISSAVFGSFVLVATLPVLAYRTYRLYYDERKSKIIALLIAGTPALFIFTRHSSPVPYDAFTAVLISLSLYLFVRGIVENSTSALFGSGIAISLAVLTKITALPLLIIYVLLLAVMRIEFPRLSRITTFCSSVIVTHLTLLMLGYNFLVQYGYTTYKYSLYKMQTSSLGVRSQAHPASALNDFIIGVFGTLYNLRWMGLPLFILAGLFVVHVARNRHQIPNQQHYTISLGMLLPLSVFLFLPLVMSGTLSRHMLVYLAPLGFVALSGFDVLANRWSSREIDQERLGQVSFLVTGVLFVINI